MITQTPLARAIAVAMFRDGCMRWPEETIDKSADCIDAAITKFFDSGPTDQATWLRMAVAAKRVERLEAAIRHAMSCPTDLATCKMILADAMR